MEQVAVKFFYQFEFFRRLKAKGTAPTGAEGNYVKIVVNDTLKRFYEFVVAFAVVKFFIVDTLFFAVVIVKEHRIEFFKNSKSQTVSEVIKRIVDDGRTFSDKGFLFLVEVAIAYEFFIKL